MFRNVYLCCSVAAGTCLFFLLGCGAGVDDRVAQPGYEAATSIAQGGGGAKDANLPQGGTAAENKLFQEVMGRLMQTSLVRENYPKDLHWPPKTFILPNSKKVLNAFASAHGKTDESGKTPAVALITEGFLEQVVKGDENVLAAIMGHELAHLINKHAGNYQRDDLKFRAFSREQEIEADLEGVKIAVAANYPYDSGVRAFYRAWLQLGSYSHFEGLSATHPSFIERLEILDRSKPKIWKSMAAFQNGYFFLHCEQYKTAETCFLAVTKEFPECAEAWANIGYARLMLYCDGLDERDLKAFGIGQFVAGCFYARPQGIDVPRNVDEKEWQEAVEALEKALKLNPNLVLARGNLGLAYLVHPGGKKAAKAVEQFNKARDQKDEGLDSLSAAAFLTNHGVAKQAEGKLDDALATYQLARALLPGMRKEIRSPVSTQLELAILYNEALIGAAKDNLQAKNEAFLDFEFYVQFAPSSSAWWALAFEQYEKLGKTLDKKTLSRQELAKFTGRKIPRIQTSIEISPGNLLVLSDGWDKALKTLGRTSMEGIPMTPSIKKIKRYNEAAPGVDVLADHKVLAIFLTSDKAPPLYVQNIGTGAEKKKVTVGMPAADFQAVMKDYFSERRYVDNPSVEYQFYPDMGLGVRVGENQRVRELVLAQIPRRMDSD